mmetsp:Transcript_20147/g.33059  ORF Transcript_20147/g.33059 Transcript_20147/m.33059 type:complete len:467 (-) Transcript_20147:141-1541(-)
MSKWFALLLSVSILGLTASAVSYENPFNSLRVFNIVQNVLQGALGESITAMNLEGLVDDCCVEFGQVESDTQKTVVPILKDLVRTTFFRIFKVNLQAECAFWKDDSGMCERPDCAVCECSKDEVPSSWQSKEPPPKEDSEAVDSTCMDCTQSSEGLEDVNLDLDRSVFLNWTDTREKLWIEPDNDDDCTYVNLLINEERYTGFGGYTAAKIWLAIYRENCFQNSKEQCLEERVFYRLISGLHASITTHIARQYCLKRTDHDCKFGPNVEFYMDRLGKFPDRVKNLYFTYLFMVRAAAKAAHLLAEYSYETGNLAEDKLTRTLVLKLLEDPLIKSLTFNETGMFVGSDSKVVIKEQFKRHFRNISRIMDCVGCEKCRMWGKLQILGIGTALKILFSEGPLEAHDLERNEVIAFVNSLAKLAMSVETAVDMRTRVLTSALLKRIGLPVFSALFLAFLLPLAVRKAFKR